MPRSLPAFDPKQLRPMREFCADGSLPFHWKTGERFCRTGVIAAVKIGISWYTTPEAVRRYFWDHANETFKKNHR